MYNINYNIITILDYMNYNINIILYNIDYNIITILDYMNYNIITILYIVEYNIVIMQFICIVYNTIL